MGIYRKEFSKLACEVRNVFPEQGTSQMIKYMWMQVSAKRKRGIWGKEKSPLKVRNRMLWDERVPPKFIHKLMVRPLGGD